MIIAHRGLHCKHLENTMEAFKEAELNSLPVELDVHLTKDGKPIVFHDDDLLRLKGVNVKISSMTLEELKRIDLNGYRIPTLEEVMSLKIPYFLVELKHSYKVYPRVEEKVLDATEGGKVQIISFDFDSLKRVREISSAETGMIFVGKIKWFLSIAEELRVNWLHPSHTLLFDDDMKNKYNFKVGTWTVDTREELERVSRLGVDSVTSNVPLKLRGEKVEGKN
ncbi:glycerophosphodiester phosphodiesterase [Sulfuracidifex metallicus]|uniref:Glycerophosphodiester phosphodiesterase n=1 Tax=Sulfuracidifex metallicus DSM 6482 = JCM 9184 TaxID=523847 RepID=A0A6A9QQR5_SULME|nr:glycerophosphodiester phosphodiesterase family protein [Sulfuracidifex metallicus]MUN29531.1 glycerophosphodiester phosphodiesterase [Sulfuracidifex metallicus DSM 6482 = JCM 9184]WOE49958.1 glycerophosphodiester phosphodiesterase family protein [Sulfuracidifex metallicus DSM 6482 = JCM 9184]